MPGNGMSVWQKNINFFVLNRWNHVRKRGAALNAYISVEEGEGLKNLSWDTYILNGCSQTNVVRARG